jgi:MarR family transcriptional regulator, organic hydroperoxide resistance regulator
MVQLWFGVRADKKKPVVVDETNNRLFFRFFQASNTLQTMSTRALDEFGVTSTQWSVLGALSRPQAADGMTVGELSQYLLVSRQNLNGVLSRLERDGLIERATSDADRRERRVTLSALGKKLWVKLAKPINVFYDHALQGLSDADRHAFIRYITLIQKNMADVDGHKPEL